MLSIEDHHCEQSAYWTYNRLSMAPLSFAWAEAATQEAKIHRIHSYPAKFPALIVQNAFDYAEQQGVRIGRVADVFCGSGTVALEASGRDYEFFGCDINPVATLIASVKTGHIDPDRFRHLAAKVVQRSTTESDEVRLSSAALDRLQRWYAPALLSALARIQNAIHTEAGEESDEARALDCAFSGILKATSQWRARSNKPALDPEKQPAQVVDAFLRQCRLMAAAWAETPATSDRRSEIVQGCVSEVENAGAPIDLIVTSPPYATSYEYSDLHQLSALWLGYVDDHRELRSGCIGTSSRRVDLVEATRRLNSVGLQIVFALYERSRILAETLAAYYLDMQAAIVRCHDLLRPGGLAVFIVGNTQLNGVRIDNANHLVESMLEAGFTDLRAMRRRVANKPNTPYRSATGRLSSQPTEMHIYAEEYILMAQRP